MYQGNVNMSTRMVDICKPVCQPSPILSVSLLEKYFPTSSHLPIPLPTPLQNALTTVYIGTLVLCAMFIAGWIIDHFDSSSEESLKRKIKEALPDEGRRKRWLLGMIGEIDREEERVGMRDVLRGMMKDAVMLDEEWEKGIWEGEDE